MNRFWLYLSVISFIIGLIDLQDNDGRLLYDTEPVKEEPNLNSRSRFLKVEDSEQPSEEDIQSSNPSIENLKHHINIDNNEGSTISNIMQSGLLPESDEEATAMKREQERYETTVLNNPKPKLPDDNPLLKNNKKSDNEKIEQFVKMNAHDIANDLTASNDKHLEMDEGDNNKDSTDGLREILKNAEVNKEKNTDNVTNNTSVNEINGNKNFVNQNNHENLTSLKSENNFLSEFSNLMKTNVLDGQHHHLEPDTSDDQLALTEEEHLNKKLDILKMKIKERQKLNQLKEEEKLLSEQKSFQEADAGNKIIPEHIADTSAKVSADHVANIETLPNNIDAPKLTLRNITDIGRVRGPGSLPNKAFFAFSYDPASPFGPPSWQLLNTEWTCTARRQSPINIETQYLMDNEIVKNIIVKVEPQNSPLSGVLRNNGHAPTLSLSSDVAVRLFGGTLSNDYYLKQLHFHFGCDSTTGSEHHINGIVYPLELHLVFWDNSTFATFPEAAKADRGIAVVSVLYQLENIPYPESKTAPLSQVVQIIRHIEEEGDNVTVNEEFNFRLEKLIPNIMNPEQIDRFYIYEGSLTTPGCYESVTWIVMATHPSVTEGQLRIFRSLKSSKVSQRDKMCNNYRPVQKKNGRRIYSNLI